MKQSFEKWMRDVDYWILVYTLGAVGHEDLTDYAYRDAYEDGESAGDVAREVLAENGFDTDGLE